MPNRVHIGIDFGTSIVKVCYFYNESIEALVFDNLNNNIIDKILFSKIYVDNNNNLYTPFESKPHDCWTINYPKMRLARDLLINQLPTAFWLHDAGLTLQQISDFCNLDYNIVKKIDDDEIPNPQKIDPIKHKILFKHEIDKAVKDPSYRLKGHFHMPFKKIPAKYDIRIIVMFFLATVISKSKDLIRKRLSTTDIEWSCTIGVPASYEDSDFKTEIDKIFKISMKLSEGDVIPSNYFELKEYYEDVQSQQLDDINCSSYPEIVAAILSYYYSSFFNEGPHLYFDVGGGTVDLVAFKLKKAAEGGVKGEVKILSAIVEPLGIQAVANDLSPDNPSQLADEIYESKISAFNKVVNEITGKYQPIVRDIQLNLRKLVIESNQKERDFFDKCFERMINAIGNFNPGSSNELMNIFMGGGGCQSKFYTDIIEDAHQRWNLGNMAVPKFQLQEIPPITEDVILHGNKFSRYIIAIGLSYPELDKLDFKLPSRIDSIPPPRMEEEHMHGIPLRPPYELQDD